MALVDIGREGLELMRLLCCQLAHAAQLELNLRQLRQRALALVEVLCERVKLLRLLGCALHLPIELGLDLGKL